MDADLPQGSLKFYDKASNRYMGFIHPDADHNWAGWLFYKHPDGQWVSLRKGTIDDIHRIVKTVDLSALASFTGGKYP